MIEKIRNLLAQQINADTNNDFVSDKSIKNISVNAENNSLKSIDVEIELGYPAKSRIAQIRQQISDCIKANAEFADYQINVTITCKIITHKVQAGLQPYQNIKNIIAVASGKGGVGKSTTAVNLALALQQEGANVGILDADIYGPSQPLMLGIADQKPHSEDGVNMMPLQSYGVKVMSIGFLVDSDTPMVWRGPMVSSALDQLLNQTAWGDLDFLIVDMPPGTGDAQLTLAQKVPVTGAVIVTTPQDIALIDAKKGLKMFEKVNIPILGIVENMSYHICKHCGEKEFIFGSGGGESMSKDYGVDLLGKLPLNLQIRLTTDGGKPSVEADKDSEEANIYREIARKIAVKISQKSKDTSHLFGKIKVEDKK